MYKDEAYMTRVLSYLMKRYGVDPAYRMAYPLLWYLRTGRASADFINRLCAAKPFVIGRLLAKEGSVDDAIRRIQAKLYPC